MRKHILGPALVVVLLALVVAASAVALRSGTNGTERRSAVVAWVTDGDTLRMRDGSRVRLVQIDAPEESSECYGRAATRELVRLTPAGTHVELESDSSLDQVDRYGRLLRYVFVGASNVNLELVRRGAATAYFYDGDRGTYADRLLAATANARANRRGMWGSCVVLWTPDRAVTTRSR